MTDQSPEDLVATNLNALLARDYATVKTSELLSLNSAYLPQRGADDDQRPIAALWRQVSDKIAAEVDRRFPLAQSAPST